MSRVFRLVLVGVLAVSALGGVSTPEASAQGQGKGEVIFSLDGLVLEQPDQRSRVVMRARIGERVRVLSERGEWLEVQTPQGPGWVLRKLVRYQDEAPPLTGVNGGTASERVMVVDEFADVKAGPGEAYLGLRRAFRGDTLPVEQRSEDGAWVQVRVEGELGWIRANQLTIARDELEGSPIGGGGGATVPPIDELPAEPEANGPIQLEVKLRGSFMLTSQFFSSNSSDPRLQFYTLDANAYGGGLGARAWILDYFGVALDYSVGFGSAVTVPTGENTSEEISSLSHKFYGSTAFRYPFGEGKRVPWVGVSGGFLFHHFSTQELRFEADEPPIFLSNTYTGVRTSLDFHLPFGPVDLWGSGWYTLAPGINQGDFNSGTASTQNYLGAEGGIGYSPADEYTFFVGGEFDQYDTNFTGPATRGPGFSSALNQDRFVTVSLGVLWRPL